MLCVFCYLLFHTIICFWGSSMLTACNYRSFVFTVKYYFVDWYTSLFHPLVDNWGCFKLHAKSAHCCAHSSTHLLVHVGETSSRRACGLSVAACPIHASLLVENSAYCRIVPLTGSPEQLSQVVLPQRLSCVCNQDAVQSHLKAWPGQVLAGSRPWQEDSSASWGIHGRSSCWVSWAGVVQPEATVALVTAASLLDCLLSPSASLSLCAAHFYFWNLFAEIIWSVSSQVTVTLTQLQSAGWFGPPRGL